MKTDATGSSDHVATTAIAADDGKSIASGVVARLNAEAVDGGFNGPDGTNGGGTRVSKLEDFTLGEIADSLQTNSEGADDCAVNRATEAGDLKLVAAAGAPGDSVGAVNGALQEPGCNSAKTLKSEIFASRDRVDNFLVA